MDEIIRRATPEDVAFIEGVINHDAVRHFMGKGDTPLTFGGALEYSITYVSDHGVMFGENIGNDTFVSLVAFKPEGSGIHAMLSIREAIKRFFTQHEVRRIVGTISMDPPNRRMIRAASILGFEVPKFVGGRAIISIDYLGWALQCSDCYQLGGEFMDENNIVCMADDMAGALGGFLMTAKHGLVAKAVSEYETYAILSHTKPILFSEGADRLYLGDKDITDAVMSLTGV